ncbi:MAG: HEAT repeat domain-containing protein [Candidatus Firestonebacteria bacterium]|nr:HEAT repeat domain-containing protein [Candidatus Firestonebacteria bacterium]
MQNIVKRFLKAGLWAIIVVLSIIVLGIAFFLYIYFTAPKPDPIKMDQINKLALAGRKSVPELLTFLDDKDSTIRYEVIMILKDFRDPRTFEPMLKELKTSKYPVSKKWAAESLGMLGDKRAVLPLIETLKDKDYSVRYKSAFALGLLGDTRALGPLHEVVKNDEMEYVSIYAENAMIDIMNQPCTICHAKEPEKRKPCILGSVLE